MLINFRKIATPELNKSFFTSTGSQITLIFLPLMKNILTLLAKSVLIPLGSTTAATTTDTVIQKKIYESGMTALII